MTSPILLLFSEGVDLVEDDDGRAVLRTFKGEISLGQLVPDLAQALRRLAGDGAQEADLVSSVMEVAGAAGLPSLLFLLQDLRQRCLISYRAAGERGPLATARPLSPYLALQLRQADLQGHYLFSRFAYMHRQQGRMVLESPLSAVQVTVHDPRVAALCLEFASPRRPSELPAITGGLSRAELLVLCSLLLSCGILAEADEGENAPADEEGTLSHWEFHDLLFHTRTRIGRSQGGYGGTFRFLGRCEPLPATKPAMSAEAYDLYRPDLERLRREDPPFTAVLEDRHSIRSFGADPITSHQLGEFLYRTARQRKVFGNDRGELSSRPYPNGGAIYELEIYLSVESCRDLPPGFYHYDPREHRLYKLPSRPEAVAALLREAASVLGQAVNPQLLLTISARFPRVYWKYESMAYALILKNLGALYQTMYLVAESMGLAACALGAGNADLFAAAAAVDYYAESSVGEFVIGSR